MTVPPRFGWAAVRRLVTGGRLRTRLAAALAVPAFAFAAVAGLHLGGAYAHGCELSAYATASTVAGRVPDLVTAVQNERARTAGQMVGQVRGTAFEAAVAAERRAVDEAYGRMERETAGGDARVRRAFATVTARFADLRGVRATAPAGQLPAPAMLEAYRGVVDALLMLLPAPAGVPDPELLAPVQALADAARAKEAASRLGAVNAFGPGAAGVDPATLADAAAGYRVALADLRSHPGLADLGGGDPAAELALLTETERRLADALGAAAADLADAQHLRTIWLAVFVAVMFALTGAASVTAARSTVRSLRQLRAEAVDVAGRSLPDAIERLRSAERQADIDNAPTAPFTQLRTLGDPDDEIGAVGGAFASVHASAIRLASEHATLRRHVNEMVVNVARRSQGLVERQLRLLDRVQALATDPDQLADLFRLDHLMTRMRRNDENLLVLAGADTSRRRPDPVPLRAVVHAAMAETEEYERVRSDVDSGVYVAGQAVVDVVHLLAELLDNASTFSPPDSRVTVLGRMSGAGQTATILIEDEGLGMTERVIADANRRLCAPAAVESAAGHQLGLLVVGRLAARHGIGVRLRTVSTGVQAEVTLPEQVMAPPPARGGAYLSGSIVRRSMAHVLDRGSFGAGASSAAADPRGAALDRTASVTGGPGVARPTPTRAEDVLDDAAAERWTDPRTPPQPLPADGTGTGGTGPGGADRGLGDGAGEAPATRPPAPPVTDAVRSSAGLPVRVPMAQLPGDGSTLSEPVPTPSERDPYDVPAALDRFYSGIHRAAAAHPETPRGVQQHAEP